MSARVYVPATIAALAGYVEAGGIPADEGRLTAPDESEETEYATLMAAATASRGRQSGEGRRVVVVAEVADPAAWVPMDRVVAVHVDTDDDAGEDDDLAWFATQEIPDLL